MLSVSVKRPHGGVKASGWAGHMAVSAWMKWYAQNMWIQTYEQYEKVWWYGYEKSSRARWNASWI